MSAGLAKQVLEELLSYGVVEFCLCPGGRNAPLVSLLASIPWVRLYYWSEERSAAFFALGRIKATGRPVAVVTTSGTAAAELLPAAMEAYYTGLPLVLLTADRPRRFRGTGAPQSAEQVGLFGCYVEEVQDLAQGDELSLKAWTALRPIHLNICFEEPRDIDCRSICLDHIRPARLAERSRVMSHSSGEEFLAFLGRVRYPLVIVGALPPSVHLAAIRFLKHLGWPVYLEGASGIRESPLLECLRITCIDRAWRLSEESGYPIDGVLRIGGVPTARLWRDLEYRGGEVAVCSLSQHPFAGLSGAGIIHVSLEQFFDWAQRHARFEVADYAPWLQADHRHYGSMERLFAIEPRAEPSLVRALSEVIPIGSKIYLGNSSPIRLWDQAATYQPRAFQIACSRGLNGIDGQLSTFLGYSSSEQENWAILGDLTLLYDMVAPWITSQIPNLTTNVVVINNHGSGLFARLFAEPTFQNAHALDFEPWARFWKWPYERWEAVPHRIAPSRGGRLIELVPDQAATRRLWPTA